MRSLRICLVLALILCGLLMTSTPAEAKQLAGKVYVAQGEHYGWKMDISIPSVIEYNMTSLNGTLIDVHVLDSSNYQRYLDGENFSSYPMYSFANITQASTNMTVLSGTVYIIVDISNYSSALETKSNSAEVQYWVTSSFSLSSVPDEKNDLLIWGLLVTLAASLVVVVAVLRHAWRSGKG